MSGNAALYAGHGHIVPYIMKRSNDAVLKRLQKIPVSDFLHLGSH